MITPSLWLGRAEARAGGWLCRMVFSLPAPLVRRLAGAPPPHAGGLHPEAWLLARLSAIAPDRQNDRVPVAEQRRRLALSAGPLAVRPRLPLTTVDHAIPGPGGAPIPARLYVPEGAPARGPLLVYFHGGGWVQGSVATHDPGCRLLAHLSGVRVLSVDYRLAPEHPYPAAAQDAIAAYAWAAASAARLGIDPERIAVGGDSAGGNLAAVVALAARDDDDLPDAAFQLLIYPAVDLAAKAPSVTTFAEGFLLTERGMDWYVGKYVPDAARRSEPQASPLRAADLAGLPPAYVGTCVPDPLRDEGEAYAERLRDAGVPVTVQRHGQVHGFFNMSAIPSARQALAVLAGALAQGTVRAPAAARLPPATPPTSVA
ncbi:MAG TPA: alpha/beta hydrolase [Baekduia sp.]|uniref:alpha/beta hydrolase n=1 Tax=Baekduia sp. TaxID=2600305 RepID=UPI002C37BBF2|nr:alpha/beta hydrolase [Baekduia sp.]HMJ32763.1 alpha/beta hydrolase [Baekduia sp.]